MASDLPSPPTRDKHHVMPQMVAYAHSPPMHCVFPVTHTAIGSMRACCYFISGFSPGKDFSRELLSLAADFQRRPTAREQLSGLDAVSHALAANDYFLFSLFKGRLHTGPHCGATLRCRMWRAMHSNEGLHTSARHRARSPPLAGSSHVRRCGASEVWRGMATEPITQDRIAARQTGMPCSRFQHSLSV